MDDTIRKVLEGEILAAAEAEAAFDRFMSGRASEVEMAALLTALTVRGERPEEVAGGVRALRKAMVPLELPGDEPILDTCGTGGGTVTTFNISTAAALVAAAAGAKIAKHGNRSFTSKCGSADVLEMLGVPIDLEPDEQRRMFEETGFVFMLAPKHHPAMRHVGPVRKALGVTTMMNLLGPLANPARVRRQVIGVARPELLRLFAESVRELGHERALIVHGEPGMDELSPCGTTHILEFRAGEIEEMTIHPSDFGWPTYEPEELAGDEPAENAERVRRVISGEEGGAARAAVALNAAAALWTAGLAEDMVEGLSAAEGAIDRDAAAGLLAKLRSEPAT